jgi:DNA primase
MLSISEKNILKSYLGDYLQKYHNIDISKSFNCLSPEHLDEHPSMSYSAKYNICHCFACGKNIDIFDIIAKDYNIDIKDFKNIINKVKELYPSAINEKNIVVAHKRNIIEEYNPVDYTDYFKLCHSNVNKTDYLKNRGISEEMIEKYNLGYDEKSKMCVFPINKNCYFRRSTFGDLKLNTSGYVNCWGEDKLKDSNESDFVIITESIIDAISLEQINDSYPVISLNSVTHYNNFFDAMKKYEYKGNVVIATDNDTRGIMNAEIIKEKLNEMGVKYSFYYPFTHDYKDINEAYLNNSQELTDSYKYLDSVLEQIKKNYKFQDNYEI